MCQCPPCVLLPPQLPPWDTHCLDALWKVGRADKVLLWNKCSRVQGLQLEKASGEAALGEVFLWFQWEGAAKEGVLCGLGRPELKTKVGEKLGDNLVSVSQKIKTGRVKSSCYTQTELGGGWSWETFPVSSSRWLQNTSGNSSLGEATEAKCSRARVGRD